MREQIPQDSQPSPFLIHTEKMLFAEAGQEHLEALDYYHYSVSELMNLVAQKHANTTQETLDEADYSTETNHWLEETAHAFMGTIYTSDEYRAGDPAKIMQLKIELIIEATMGVNKFFKYNQIRKREPVYRPHQYERLIKKLESIRPEDGTDHYLLGYVRELYRKVQLSV